MQVKFSIHYVTKWGETLSLVLDDVKHPMQWNDGGLWTVTVDCKSSSLKDYTYVVMCGGLITRMEWDHHSAKFPAGTKNAEIADSWIVCPIDRCPFNYRHQAEKFDRPGFRGAGTAVPIFSLRTDSDFGVGEFLDLKPLVDWAAATGQCIIQTLPVNDTTRKGEWKDSYPYSPVSAFALHPMYINLQDAGVKEDAAFKKLQKELNALPELDYPRVFKEMMRYLRKAFKQNGAADSALASFAKFCKENSFWLDEYADFCAKRDGEDRMFYVWMQYHLDRQFSKMADYARRKGVSLKGDLPVGISSDSAEAYWHPQLFNLDSSTGAPPDFFSTEGQNWGFPTYNWEEMAKDDYAWWKARLRKMSRYYDAFRIDHILGFFRIWEIPADMPCGLDGHFNPAIPYTRQEIEGMQLPVQGLFHDDPRHPGCLQPLITPDTSRLEWWQKERFDALYTDFFYHRHDEFWRVNAEKKLPELLGATRMLACGEDLGMVPDCVQGVMDHEKILSLEMSMMDKGRPWPHLSVCATSSHDMSTLRMQNAEAGRGDLSPEGVKEILLSHLGSQSMLAIFPIQDWVALDENLRRADFLEERVNHPEDPNHHWRYRFHSDVGGLLKADALNSQIRFLLQSCGR